MKSKNKKILNLLLLGILFSTFLFHFDNNNNNNNVNYARNTDHNDVSENANTDRLKSQSINQDNSYSGIGEPWNLTHYANRTDYGESISFNNGSSDTASVPLGSGWEGYKLQSDIYNLHDTRNWNNGTFDFGPMGEYNPGDNDDYLTSNNPYQNWTFTAEDVTDERGYVNEMSGNYLNESYDQDTEERSSLELRMDANSNSSVNAGYSKGDKCYWNSSFKVPRGKVIDSQLTFDANPMHLADFNSWELAFSINGMKSYSIGTYSLKEYGEGLWHSFSIPLGLWSNTSSVYPSILNDSMI
ncbi:MAG: hypothetical protein ACOC35_14620, partial [Promethearchaeia archaeon]